MKSFSYWEQSTFLNSYDVIIIGSGIVGLNAALQLKKAQPKLKVALLERGLLPTGASTKNAGFACFGSVSELLSEIKTYGEDAVFRMVQKRMKGLQILREHLGDEAISFEQKGGYELFLEKDEKQMEASISSIPYLNELLKPLSGNADIFTVDNAKIADFGLSGVKAMITNSLEGQLNIGAMMMALIYKVQALGVMIFGHCEVLSFSNEDKVFVKTREADFYTQKLVLATNAFTSPLLPDVKIKPARGQVLVTEPIHGLKLKGSFHYDEGFYYFRDVDSRILLGGGRNLDFEREETFEMNFTAHIQQKLEQMLYEVIFPNRRLKIDHRWSGIMGFGAQLEPIVKKQRESVFVAAGGNGMGVAIGSLTGMEVADLVLAEL